MNTRLFHVLAALLTLVAAGRAQLLTITNPTPVLGENFGWSVAAVGADRFVIGAIGDAPGGSAVGAAYLYDLTGNRLVTITNPAPSFGDEFGIAVASAGGDLILIGAHQEDAGAENSGAAYLFTTNGALQLTLTNPAPSDFDRFGWAVSAVGIDRVLIGAPGDSAGADNSGSAYVFDLSGTLFLTLTNPSPADYDQFGTAVAGLDSTRVLVGAPGDDTGAEDAGAVYLLGTDGTLLTTLTNPLPLAFAGFGSAVAAVGSDRILVGSPGDSAGADGAGAAYLFNTNGVLLTIFTNPTPANFEAFGWAVAAVDSERVLISAYQDGTGAAAAGTAYLYNADGTLLNTFTNPVPAEADSFGVAVTGLGGNHVVIGAHADDAGAEDAGTVYVFELAASQAQTNVTAHYADGQVWIVWTVDPGVLANCVPTLTPVLSNGVPFMVSNCLPQTYAIYCSPQPVTNTANAALVGRLFAQEWSAEILRNNINASFGVDPGGFTVPNGLGGMTTLTTNQGLFVHTVRSNFTAYYAVRPFGETNVPAEWSSGPVVATYSLAPEHAPKPQLQGRGANQGYPVEWWTLWVDGDANRSAGRPDFPIMENQHKRGVPHNFSICEPKVGVLPPTNRPTTIAVHSGDAQAKMWLPDNAGFKSIGLIPVGGLLVALEDRFFSVINGAVDATSVLSTGYVPTFDPFRDAVFGPGIAPAPADIPANGTLIHPYPLWRFNWTLDWLVANQGVDSNRVAVAAHSGGAKGSVLWTHANPERFAAVNLYGPALGDFPDTDARLVGTRAQNLPMLLTNRLGQLARATDIHQFTASFSPKRDLPFTRVFIGKREQNWVVDDNSNSVGDITEQYVRADALGIGAALFWDLREHGVGKWTYTEMVDAVLNPRNCSPNLTTNLTASWSSNDLWVATLDTQFRRDDALNQYRFRADQSYPAFFNCALRAGHENPGAVIYAGNSVPFDGMQSYDGLVTTTECRPPWTGHKRGTWGGYCEWETNVTDTPTNWSAVLYLVGTASAFNPVEICPDAARTVDVAIRRPRQFKPATGALVVWELRNAANNVLSQSGTNLVGPDDLVSIPALVIPRDPFRARLTVSLLPVPAPCQPAQLSIRLLSLTQAELTWLACADRAYQVEWTGNFGTWQFLSPPLAAPAGGGWMTNVINIVPTQQFFRLNVYGLTNSPIPTTPGIYGQQSMVHDGIPRHYRLSIPTNYTGTTPAPLALIFHGSDQTAAGFAAQHPTLMNHANALDMILVIPDSTAHERGTGWFGPAPVPGESSVDDVGFVLDLIERLDTSLNIDRKRVYAGGFSNGGQLCHYLAGRTTNVFAAIAAVGAAIAGAQGSPTNLVYPPLPPTPMPALIVNATNDCSRPYWGGLDDNGNPQPAVAEAVAHYTNANLCAEIDAVRTNAVVTNFISRFKAECGGPYPAPATVITNLVIRETYITCATGTEVALVTLTDGGHKWPDPSDNVGFDANREVLEFFARHCRCDAVGATNWLTIPTAPGQYLREFCDQGYWRKFRLAIPSGYNGMVERPLLFTFHGGEQTIAEFAGMHPDLFTKCNTEGIFLVLPEATKHPYSRDTLWGNKPFDVVVDDRVFVTNLLAQLDGTLNINQKKVYGAGFSSGGRFCNWMAATWTNVFAAIAPVCSQIGWNDPATGALVAPPTPLEPLPVFFVRGSLDRRQPFNGGTNNADQLSFSAAEDLNFWVNGSGCTPPPTVTAVGVVMAWEYTTCLVGTEVKLEAVSGLGHEWPESPAYNASLRVVDFLLRFTRP